MTNLHVSESSLCHNSLAYIRVCVLEQWLRRLLQRLHGFHAGLIVNVMLNVAGKWRKEEERKSLLLSYTLRFLIYIYFFNLLLNDIVTV